MSSEDEDMEYETPLTLVRANSSYIDGVPFKSNSRYSKVYEDFQKWNEQNGTTPVTECVLLKYFKELATKSKPTTLWVYHSILKSTLRINDNIDVSSFPRIISFVKEKNAGYIPFKATTFTEEDMEKFINDAPDEYWLDVKVFCIFGINGVQTARKLMNVMIDHIKIYDDLILVTIPKSDNSAKRTFTVTGKFFTVMHKYIQLRPEHSNNRFFLNYKDEICKTMPIGRNKFLEMPRRIAKYLKLPKPQMYSGNSFRINTNQQIASSNSTIVYESLNSVPEQPKTEYSLDHATGHLRSLASVTNATPSASTTLSKVNNSRHDHHRNDKRNGSQTDSETNEHICTISCGQVKCASEENETDASHAFAIMKPCDYHIVEVVPAQFASDPICRWIVSYTHTVEPVTSYNADETFADITRSTPNNVTVIQKYVRFNSSQLLAAYVVVYGVNCRCQSKQSCELYVNEMKYEV